MRRVDPFFQTEKKVSTTTSSGDFWKFEDRNRLYSCEGSFEVEEFMRAWKAEQNGELSLYLPN